MATYAYTFNSGDTVTPTRINDARTISDIVNADIKSDAAIAGTKIAPAFGAQDITVSTANRSITNTGNFALSFGTNNTERVRIDNAGNVGIGTTSPNGETRLHVVKDGASEIAAIRVDNPATSGNSVSRLDVFNGRGVQMSLQTFQTAAILNVTSNHELQLRTNNTERMRIDGSGNVGIGTTSPTAKLEVDGGIKGRAASSGEGGQFELLNPDNGSVGLVVDVSDANVGRVFTGSTTGGELQLGQLAGTGAVIKMFTASTERMRIDASGNVGIGTSPSQKFHVVGDILTTTSTWGTSGTASVFLGDNLNFLSSTFGGGTGLTSFGPVTFTTGVTPTERMRIDASGNVGIGGTANAAAILDAASTTKGFLPPRMTTAQRDAISTPPAGLVIYNTSTNVLNFYNGSAWGAV
jgi:hypothetical protein